MILRRTFIITALLAVALVSCKKDTKVIDPPVDEKTKLPQVTTTGAGTFGAIVKGKAFIGKIIECTYTHDNNFPDYYNFTLTATDANKNIVQISLPVVHKLAEKNSYTLNSMTFSEWAGKYTDGAATGNPYQTNATDNGAVSFSKTDDANKIFSGTFSFAAANSAGEKVTITDGRFDTHYVYTEE
jgi:hypothetical protein